MPEDKPWWIFGYGSLMWKQDFPYDKMITGIVHNHARRFWQRSPDHRGTPDMPGRTVTLVIEPNAKCWGMAFRVPASEVAETRKYLDFREKAGYACERVLFHPDDKMVEPFEVEVYMATDTEDEHHTGPSTVEEIVETILKCHGPSGPNLEYAMRIAKILHELAPHCVDEHVIEIEKRLLENCRRQKIGIDILKPLGYEI